MLDELAADAAEIAAKLHGPELQPASHDPDMTELQETVFIEPPQAHTPQYKGTGYAKLPSRRALAEAGAKRHNGKIVHGK